MRVRGGLVVRERGVQAVKSISEYGYTPFVGIVQEGIMVRIWNSSNRD